MMTVFSQLSFMSAEQIARLMRFSVEDRERFLGIFNPKPHSKETGRPFFGLMADDVRKVRQKFRSKEEE